MKSLILFLALSFSITSTSNAQLKEAAQLATLSPTILVIYSGSLENYQRNHYMLSTIGYLGSYMITESIWKSAVITLGLGIAKELIYDGLLGRGESLWDDMKWNTLGVAQGTLFTVSLRF